MQRSAGQDERDACKDAGESQGLAAETKQQRHHQHPEIQDELRAVGDRYASEQPGRQAEPTCLPAREPAGPVADPQRSEQKRQGGRFGGEVPSIGDVQRPERAEERSQGGGGRVEQQAR
jgi:hypothetical protein